MNITLKNTSTGERLVLPLKDFKQRFKTELDMALAEFIACDRQTKLYPHIAPDESDFMLDLRWNFNNFANSPWKIMVIR